MIKKTAVRVYSGFLLALVVALLSGAFLSLRSPSTVCVKNNSGVVLKHISITTYPIEYRRETLAEGEEWKVTVEPDDTQDVVVQLDWNGSMRTVECGGIDRFCEYRGIIVGPGAEYVDVNFDPTGRYGERSEWK